VGAKVVTVASGVLEGDAKAVAGVAAAVAVAVAVEDRPNVAVLVAVTNAVGVGVGVGVGVNVGATNSIGSECALKRPEASYASTTTRYARSATTAPSGMPTVSWSPTSITTSTVPEGAIGTRRRR
jgi:hypothetical protein